MEQEPPPRRPRIVPAASTVARQAGAARLSSACLLASGIGGVAFRIAARPMAKRQSPSSPGRRPMSVRCCHRQSRSLARQSAHSGVRLAAAEPHRAATPSAPAGPQDNASSAVSAPSEQAQLLQTMARDLATMQQGIEALKASQEQLASENAKTAEQLRASRSKVTRLVAKISELEQRARPPAPPPQAGSRTGAQVPRLRRRSPQARAQPMPLQPAAPARGANSTGRHSGARHRREL